MDTLKTNFKAVNIAEQVVRKTMPSTNEVFDRYW